MPRTVSLAILRHGNDVVQQRLSQMQLERNRLRGALQGVHQLRTCPRGVRHRLGGPVQRGSKRAVWGCWAVCARKWIAGRRFRRAGVRPAHMCTLAAMHTLAHSLSIRTRPQTLKRHAHVRALANLSTLSSLLCASGAGAHVHAHAPAAQARTCTCTRRRRRRARARARAGAPRTHEVCPGLEAQARGR